LANFYHISYTLFYYDIIIQNHITTSRFIQRLSESKEGKVVYTVEDFDLRAPTVVYGAVLKGGNGENLYLFINSILLLVDATTVVLKNQLKLVTILSFLLSIGLSFIIASKVSRPITNVTNAASTKVSIE
jgi:hypothetical protein